MENSYDLRILEPEQIRLFYQMGALRLTLHEERSYVRARVYRAFPISNPTQYYGLVDGAGKDIGMLPHPEKLDSASRAVAEDALEKRYFVPIIKSVNDVIEDYGAIVWDVETDRGRKVYVVRNMRDNLSEISSVRVLITDIEGNRFEIHDLSQLPVSAQNLVMRNL